MDPDDDGEPFGGALNIGSETTEAEKEFEKVLDDMREAEGLKLYSDVYTKLYDSYYKMKEENTKNLDHVASLTTKLQRFDDTVSSYQTEVTEANKTIEKLRADIEEARALADAMHARELASVESLETMKKTVTRLEKELDARKRAGDDDAGATSAVKEKEKFEKEKARLQGELDGIKLRLNNALNYVEELEQRNTVADETIAKLEERLEEADNNAVRQNRLVEHLKGESDTLKAEMESRGNTINILNDKLSKSEKTIERRDRQLKELNNKLEIAKAEEAAALEKATNLRETLDMTNAKFEQTKQTLINTTKELKVFNLERELGRERLRVRALEEALETPLNVHRWRKLQGTDPESVQLTQKLRLTQK
ncbi:unnamed protein product [Diatraea saccharalis]|uniref:Uncharacterized protein n=1 Tax=Diatraea saccharalis TaxID=40085 RepID=A0A9N9WIX0_9NEOP|nr:unnamed protein product [Diatraea saccharalis]